MKRFEFDHEDRKHLIAEGLRCPVCGGDIHPRGTVEYDMVQYLRFHCSDVGHHPVLRVDTIDGHIKMHFYALPEDVTFGWFHEPIEEPEPEPIVFVPEPVVTRESEAEQREKRLHMERTANALEAHRKIAEFVLSKRRNKIAFANRSTVVGRLAKLRQQWVWAVDSSNPAIEEILNDHGGKVIIGKLWEDLKLILTSQKKHGRGGVAAQRTFSATLGSRDEVYCYLFSAKSLEDARKGVLQIGSMF